MSAPIDTEPMAGGAERALRLTPARRRTPWLARLTSFFVGLVAWLAQSVHAGPGGSDSTFNPGAGVEDGPVIAISLPRDGKLLLGGFFSRVNGSHRSSIVRLQGEGGLDDSFHLSGLGGHLHAVLALPDGKILIGGDFVGSSSFPRIDVARVNSDGTVDPIFNAGESSGEGHVDALALQPDGKIVLAGDFSTFDRTARQGVVRLLPNGGLDLTFDAGAGLVGHISSLVLVDNKILIGGGFTNSQGAVRLGISRLNADGSLDTAFRPSPGVTRDSGGASVNALALQRDGRILIGGNFTGVNGRPCNRVGRLNADGSFDPTFDSGSGVAGDAIASVDALVLQGDGKVVLAGWFTTVNGWPRNSIARLNRDGSLDTTFDPGTGANDRIKALAMPSQGRILAAGAFNRFNGVAAGRITCLQGDFWPPDPTPVSLSSGSELGTDGFRFWVAGGVNGSFTVEYSADLRVWRTLTNFVSVTASSSVLDPVPGSPQQRFYRALTPR